MPPEPSPSTRTAWPQRLHAALMPDYNRAATAYWWTATVSGGLLLLVCLARTAMLPPLALLQVAAALLFAIGAGLFPVRIPGTRVSFGVGELAFFVILLLQGPEPAATLAAAEAGIGSFRTSKRWTSRLGSPAMATLAMFAAAWLFEAGRDTLADQGVGHPVPLLALALAIGFVYFFLSATLLGGTARLKRGEHLLQPGDLLGTFRWIGLAYAGSALFATLLVIAYEQAGAGVFGVTVPLLAMLLLVLHFFFRQQEAQEAMRAALADIARRETVMREREAETAVRHERELTMSERRFRGAFERAAIGMALVDLDGRVLQANETLARLLHHRPDEMTGLGFAGLLHAYDRAAFVGRLAAARDVHFEDFRQDLRLVDAGLGAVRVRLHCSFFGGPAAAGAAQAGRPCLLLQVQPLDEAPPPRTA